MSSLDSLERFDGFELICCIVNCGQGSKALKIAKQNGVKGGTICIGRGTVKSRFLEILGLTDKRKEIVIMITEKETAKKAMEAVSQQMAFQKPYHGIGFSFSVSNFIGTKNLVNNNIKSNGSKKNEVNQTMHNAIFTVVERGRAEDVIEVATKSGARGGTIINARGSGIHETDVFFSMAIEPEKEMVMILVESAMTEGIVNSIREQLKIDEPGRGIVFVVDLNETYGLY